ncbi:hypothetical protein BP5796_05698 [Coleophoma crateriformis]|uniref:Uncharacterized protein n=1 Tax=Coleophoma crateriformis TaxID=565419 RepID=A0A3D8RV46_9HELO|nr:hypothetical protein BP5796_05698 [Coleophoma crateriformis]
MSKNIPDMKKEEEIPYCIWHPHTADEPTYRALAKKYPQMRYHVGRPCAVAGYTNLFHELDLLSDISIAEEARDNNKLVIFDSIMSSPFKYAVMNDYTRSINTDNPRVGNLNADTAVRSTLEIKQKYRSTPEPDDPSRPWPDHQWQYYFFKYGYHFNITEDWCVDENETDLCKELPGDAQLLPLLYSPLPLDLPNIDKDLLVLTAAYYGDIDRYARLRRPHIKEPELSCIVRGIYHNTMFAKWWSNQPEAQPEAHEWKHAIRCAITARFIMNNDLSRVTEETPERDLPYLIYYPSLAQPSTYEELVRRKPSMAPQVARASIIMDHQWLYDKLPVKPDQGLMREAKQALIHITLLISKEELTS